MGITSSCLDQGDLSKLASGLAPASRIEEIIQHLETCAKCLSSLQTIVASDTLLDALGKVKSLPDAPVEPAVSQLVEKLKALSQQSRSVEQKAAASYAGEITEGLTQGTEEENLSSFLAPAERSDEIGRLGGYRVLEVLGRGGMGIVFKAKDPDLQRLIALKVMLPAVAAAPSARRRFLVEARAAAALKHDHIVTIHQVGEDRGAPFLAMEFLHGESLEARIERDGTLPVVEAVRIARQIADGLTAAHARGLIHRDIKPANIWLESGTNAAPEADERVKILDFGLARLDGDNAKLTQTGLILGTPAYMAPEQASGEEVDPRCDLFSLGCVLYRLCTGELPFKGNTSKAIFCSLMLETPKLPSQRSTSLPQEVSDLIMQLLAKDPEQRPAKARTVAEALRELERRLADSPSPSAPRQPAAAPRRPSVEQDEDATGQWQSSAQPTRTPPRRRRAALTAAAVGALALLIAGIVFYLPAGKGTIRVETNEDAIEVVLTKTGARIKTAGGHGDLVVAPGEHSLKIKRGDLELETEKFVLKKGETVTLKVEWLKDKLTVARADEAALLGSREAKSQKKTTPSQWTPTGDQQAYLNAVSKLSLKPRIDSVRRKFREVNRVGREEQAPELVLEPKEGPPTSCRIPQRVAYDIWPLAALSTLASVDLTATRVIDFRPLSRLPLMEVHIKLILDNVASEEALKGMTTLRKVNDRPVAEYWAERAEIRKDIDKMAKVAGKLSIEDRMDWLLPVMRKLNPKCPEIALKAISLPVSEKGRVMFRAYDIGPGVFDYSPVRALAIDDFFWVGHGGDWFDLTPLANTQIKSYKHDPWRGSGIRDLSPLAGLPLTDLGVFMCPISDLRPLAGMKLESLDCSRTLVADLSPLKNMPLKTLSIPDTQVSDLTPLKGMPLRSLQMSKTKVTNLSPLQGMKLQELFLAGCPVLDIAPLKDVPLEKLNIGRVRDLSPLKGMPLKELAFHFRLHFDPDEKLLRSLPLAKINGMTPADFWKDVEKRRKADQEVIAWMAQVPLNEEALKKAIWDKVGQYPPVKIVDGDVVESGVNDGNGGRDCFAAFLAFPKLRKLSLNMAPSDFSPLLKLPLLEELECPAEAVSYNLVILRLMPKLKTINGKPAQEVLGQF